MIRSTIKYIHIELHDIAHPSEFKDLWKEGPGSITSPKDLSLIFTLLNSCLSFYPNGRRRFCNGWKSNKKKTEQQKRRERERSYCKVNNQQTSGASSDGILITVSLNICYSCRLQSYINLYFFVSCVNHNHLSVSVCAAAAGLSNNQF